MTEPEQQATIDTPRAIRVKTSTGWADLVIKGPTGATGPAGAQGPQGPAGAGGAAGPPGQGVPAGGALATVLSKKSAADYDTQWAPAAPATDLRYDGDWVAGSYSDGDIVVYQGVAYLCTKPTSSPPVPWQTTSAAAVATTLPSTPGDGQQAVLVDSLTAPTFSWLLQWSLAAARWLFIGGSPANVEVLPAETTASAAYVDLPTPTAITVPRAGSYTIAFGATIYNPTDDQYCKVAVKLGAAGTSDNEAAQQRLKAGAFVTVARTIRRTLAANDVAKLQYAIFSSASNAQFQWRWLNVTPVWVT